MSAITTLYDALYGNPVTPDHKPDRAGVLSAFTMLYNQIVALTTGVVSYETKAAMDADTTRADGTQARVWNDPTPANNTFYISDGGIWSVDTNFLNLLTALFQPFIDLAQAWAESAGAPGAPGTKSAKTWAGEAAASALAAEGYADDAADSASIARPNAHFLDRVVGFNVKLDTVFSSLPGLDAKALLFWDDLGRLVFDIHPDAPAVSFIENLIVDTVGADIDRIDDVSENALTLGYYANEQLLSIPQAKYYIASNGSDFNAGHRIGLAKQTFAGMLAGLPYAGVRVMQTPAPGSGGQQGSYWAAPLTGDAYEPALYSYEVTSIGTVVGSVTTRNRVISPGKYPLGSATPTFGPVHTGTTMPTFNVSEFGPVYQPGDVIGLVSEPGAGFWRETFYSYTIGLTFRGILKPTATRLPIIDGSKVITPASFTASAHADAGGVVYEFTWSMDAVNGGRTHNQGQTFPVWQDNSPDDPGAENLTWFKRVGSVAACAAEAGTIYYNLASFGTNLATPGTVYIHPYGNTDPRSDGKTYKAPNRYSSLDLGYIDDCTVQDIAHACVAGNNGGMYTGKNTIARRCIVGFSGEHAYVVASGIIEDCISFDGDGYNRATNAQGSDSSAVFYTADAAGQSYEYRRFIVICPDRPNAIKHEMMLAHQGTGTSYDYGKYVGCIGVRVASLTGVVQAKEQHMIGCVGIGLHGRFGLFSGNATKLTVSHCIAHYGLGTTNVMFDLAGFVTPANVTVCNIVHNYFAFPSDQTGGLLMSVGQVIPNSKVCNNFFRFHTVSGSVSLSNATHATFEFKRNIIVCGAANAGPWQRGLTANPVNAAKIDYNVYIKLDGTNPLWWYRSDTAANVTTLAAWQALGFDLHSVVLTQAQADTLFLNGVAGMLAGDYRINPECDLRWGGGDNTRIVDGPNPVGPQEYYNHNEMRIAAGQPSRLPTPPTTWQGCHDYLLAIRADPTKRSL